MMRNEFHVSPAMPALQEPDEVSADEDSGEERACRIAEGMRVLRKEFCGEEQYHKTGITSAITSSRPARTLPISLEERPSSIDR